MESADPTGRLLIAVILPAMRVLGQPRRRCVSTPELLVGCVKSRGFGSNAPCLSHRAVLRCAVL